MKEWKQRIVIFLAFVMLVLSISACGTNNSNKETNNVGENASSQSTEQLSLDDDEGKNVNEESDKRKIVDVVGDEVEIPTEVNTVINLVPFGCQIMIGLGLGDYLIGINEETIETPWLEVMYPEVKNIQTYAYEPDAEAILAANPDIVFCADQETAQEFRDKGITAITIMYYSIDDFKKDIQLFGEILGGNAKEKCTNYLGYFDAAVSDVDEHLKDNITERETLYYINGTSDRGFYKTAGAGSTNDAVAQLAYAELATNSIIESPETKVDAEAILAVNPENVIIGGAWQHVLYDELFASDEWSHIKAIESGNVFKVPMSMAAWNRYSIEIALMIPWTASMIYPEYYEFNAIDETIDFYKQFSGYELTEQQAEYMIKGLTPDGEKEISSR